MVSPALPAYDYAVIVLDNGVSTPVSEVEVSGKAIKVMINQQIYILQGEHMYNVKCQQQ